MIATAIAAAAATAMSGTRRAAAQFWQWELDNNYLCDHEPRECHQTVSDGAGGIITVWRREEFDREFAVQRIDAGGDPAWDNPITPGSIPLLVTDGVPGGAWIAWGSSEGPVEVQLVGPDGRPASAFRTPVRVGGPLASPASRVSAVLTLQGSQWELFVELDGLVSRVRRDGTVTAACRTCLRDTRTTRSRRRPRRS